jgi:TetR/AcrR family transcriptional repressor of nem operon
MSNKDKIMEAATELFHLYGYDGTSIDMLIKKAGVSKSNFYYYFEGKEELGLSVLTKLADNQVREFSEIMQTDLNALEQLMEIYKKVVLSHSNLLEQPIYPGCFFGNISLEQSSINEKFRSLLDKYFRECETLVEECLRKGMEQGFFKEDLNPKELARFFVSQFEGAIVLAKTKKSLSTVEDIIWQGKNLILKDEWMRLTSET